MPTEKPTSGAFAGTVARNRQQAYNVLVDAVERSDLSQVRIAEFADISQEHLSRMLQRPRNVELDTLSKIVFAACGAALGFHLVFPSKTAHWRTTEVSGSTSDVVVVASSPTAFAESSS